MAMNITRSGKPHSVEPISPSRGPLPSLGCARAVSHAYLFDNLGALKLMCLFLMFCSAEPFPGGVTKKSGRGRAMDARQRNLEPGRNAEEKKFGLGHGEERGEGGGHNEQ
ncbi:uncharacterized protein RSE6_10977 [Rhynchosporium secalis]|uniref:Uncharacterized protein n=1 Tax=Rhynchosporium secalis TaxID=38038 RepID=A0A1E1MMU2_RHYSE|nr:uncharacterized protein RSE6_10977 [Rhynchosporium secalis]